MSKMKIILTVIHFVFLMNFCLPTNAQSRSVQNKNPRTPQDTAPLVNDLNNFDAEINYPEKAGFTNFICTWKTEALSNQIRTFPCLHEENIYINLGGIVAINRMDGDIKWKFEGRFAGRSNISSSPCILNDLLFVGTNSGAVISIDCETGLDRWIYKTGGSVQASVYIDINAEMVFVGAFGKKFHAIDLKDGQGIWAFPTIGDIGSKACVIENYVYYVCQNQLVCLEKNNGSFISKATYPKSLISGPINYEDGSIFVWCSDGNLYKAKINSELDNKRVLVEQQIIPISKPRKYIQEGFPHCKYEWFGKKLLLLDDAGTMILFDPEKAEVVWTKQENEHQKRPCDFTNYENEHILSTFNDGSLACIDLKNGNQQWKTRFPGVFRPRILWSNDQLILTSNNGFIIAYEAY
ncbi:MAG: outer membrane protein assembly factor BamB family protein [Planctomycetota bacterium]